MISIYCPHCERYTGLNVATVEVKQAYGNELVAAIWRKSASEFWWIGICNSCQEPVLVKNQGDVVYPASLPSPTDENIPPELASDLNEAKMCFSVDCYRACTVMARRCLQNACMLKGAKKTDLVDQIKELTAAGAITKDIEEWATVVRWVGNDASHPGKEPVTKEDAEDCLKLAEQFLHVVFVAPAIAQARKTARGK